MKARIKATGEIIDVECRFYAKIGSIDPIIHNSLLEILKDDETIDWKQRRYELAKSAMQGYCIALGINDDSETYDDIAIGSLRVADALIKKLKGE